MSEFFWGMVLGPVLLMIGCLVAFAVLAVLLTIAARLSDRE